MLKHNTITSTLQLVDLLQLHEKVRYKILALVLWMAIDIIKVRA